jgi:hypothetical protein
VPLLPRVGGKWKAIIKTVFVMRRISSNCLYCVVAFHIASIPYEVFRRLRLGYCSTGTFDASGDVMDARESATNHKT